MRVGGSRETFGGFRRFILMPMLPQADPSSWTVYEAAHLLNRAGFGGNPDEIRAFHALGRVAAVDSLLGADGDGDLPPPEWAEPARVLADAKARFAERRELQMKLRGLPPAEAEKLRRESGQAAQREERRHAVEAQAWWFDRMASTSAPLREKMTLFWHDHFATSIQKVRQPGLMVAQNELFRRHALGSFRDLTQAVLLDPAMMLYLDTQNSRKGKPNENFAREVMELFTLGEGNYTEEDIREAARAFTGYQLNRFTGGVTHARRQWDDGSKTIFGKTGAFDGKAVIDLLFEQPAAAPFISRKIWEFFVYEKPSSPAVDALAATLRKADFRIAPLLREIFLSQEFYSESAIRSQIKSPVQFLVQLLKQLEIARPPAGFPITAQQQLGQVLFLPPNVAGWDWGQAWINTNTLLTRYNLAGFITKGAGTEPRGLAMDGGGGKNKLVANAVRRASLSWTGPDYEKIAPRPLRDDPAKLVDSLVFRFFHGPVPEKARASFVEYATSKKGAVFTNKETAELCHLMLSTPYYQLF